MAKRTRDEMLEIVGRFIGDRTDDEALELLEDVRDSFEESGEDWESKYRELDQTWRTRYRETFLKGVPESYVIQEEKMTFDSGEEEQVHEVTYDDLFKEGE